MTANLVYHFNNAVWCVVVNGALEKGTRDESGQNDRLHWCRLHGPRHG
jgi:hypothetical protein